MVKKRSLVWNIDGFQITEKSAHNSKDGVDIQSRHLEQN